MLTKNRQLLDMLAKSISPKPELVVAERQEHLELFNLIGDPMLRMPHPQAIAVKAPNEAVAGSTIAVEGNCPLTGALLVELVSQRDQQRVKRPPRGPYVESTLAMREFDRTYVRANNRQWCVARQSHQGGKFQCELNLPENCQGPCFVRVFLDGTEWTAVSGSRQLTPGHASGRHARVCSQEIGKNKGLDLSSALSNYSMSGSR